MAAGSSKLHGKKEVDVNALLQKLRLNETERSGVVLTKEVDGGLPTIKWMAAAKLLTVRDFSESSLKSTMISTWSPAREVSFRSISKNLFVVQASCLGDWKRIMEEGPWIFCGCALMLEEFDGSTAVPRVVPQKVPAWVQIHKVPLRYKTEAILKLITGRIGEEVIVEMRAVSTSEGDFFRVRVNLEAATPLVRFVTLTPEGRDELMILILYEKLPRFCAHCGLMGHTYMECGTGEYAEEDLQYGDWMVANEETWRPGTPKVRAHPMVREQPREDCAGRATVHGRGGGHTGKETAQKGVWRKVP